MTAAAPESPERQNESVRAAAEHTQNIPDEAQEKEAVQQTVEQKRLALSEDVVREKARTGVETIETDVTLSQLTDRVPAVEAVLQESQAQPQPEPTNKERLKQDVDTAAKSVTESIVVAYEAAKEKYLKPLQEKTKDIFLIGPLIATLSDFSPSQIKDVVTRKGYEFLASADMFGGEDGKGCLGKMLGGVSDNARRNLAIFNIQDTIKMYASENTPGETIVFDGNISKVQWQRMKKLTEKNPEMIATNVGTLIEQKRNVGVKEIMITCADLLAPPANAEAPRENAREAALIAAKKEITAAEKIVIANEPSGIVTLDWAGEKTVTLPMTTDVSKSTINALIGMRPDNFAVLKIGPNDSIGSNDVLLENRSGVIMLFAENTDEVLRAIPNHLANFVINGSSQKFKYQNGSFSPITGEPMRVTG